MKIKDTASLIWCDSISWLFDNSISTSINYDYGFLGPWLIQDHHSRWWFVQDHNGRWWFVGDLPSSFCVLDFYVCNILNTTLESYVRRDWICSLLILVRMWLSMWDNQAHPCKELIHLKLVQRHSCFFLFCRNLLDGVWSCSLLC